MPTNWIIQGDCLDVLRQCADDSVDLIFTSPPYAEQRKSTYGGIPVDEYSEWFLARSAEFLRVLKPMGTFMLNIKEHVDKGERSTYVIELILELRKQGWLWTEEYMWSKKNAVPGKWSNRFRDSWERLLQFNKDRKFDMYQDEVKTITKNSSQKRRLSGYKKNDELRYVSETGSNFGNKRTNLLGGRITVYPSNVLVTAVETQNQNHPAVFPVNLPQWFIRLFTRPGDLVLDPFSGSGSTAVAAKRLRRQYIGIDISSEYCAVANNRLEKTLPMIAQNSKHLRDTRKENPDG